MIELKPRVGERWTPEKQALWEETIKECTSEKTFCRLEEESYHATVRRIEKLRKEYDTALSQRTRQAYIHFLKTTKRKETKQRVTTIQDPLTGIFIVEPVPEWWWKFVDNEPDFGISWEGE